MAPINKLCVFACLSGLIGNLAARHPAYAKSEAWYGYKWKANDGNVGTHYFEDGS